MFTVKYRDFNPGPVPGSYFPNEQLHGPFLFISQEYHDDSMVVLAVPEHGEFTRFGPATRNPEDPEKPTPIVWVMNEQGATVAKYDL